MFVLTVTFAVVFFTITGMYWVFVARPEHAAQQAVRDRLVPASAVRSMRLGLLKDAERLSSVPSLNRFLVRRSTLVAPLQRFIGQSGVRMTVGVFLLSSGCLFVLGYLVLWAVTRQAWLSVCAGAIASIVPYVYLRRALGQRVKRFEELFPEALDLVTRALRAGHAFTTGLSMVAEEMPEPIAGEFRLLYEHQNFGLPLPEALKSFAERVPLIDARFFATAVLTQRGAGGNLSEVLDNLASVMRDRFKVKRDLRIKSAHGRLTGWILAGLPPTMVVMLSFINPNHFRILINDPIGVRLIVGALVLQVVGTLIIRKIVNFDY